MTFLIAIRALCGITFFAPSATLVSKQLVLDWVEGPDSQPMECGCCYDLEYTVTGVSDPDIVVIHKGKKLERTSEPFYTYPIRFDIRNGDTTNYVDKYDRRQGMHSNGSGKLETHWLDGVQIKQVHYHQNGKIKILEYSDIQKWVDDFPFMMDSTQFLRMNHHIEYYESGSKKRECHNSSWKREAESGGKCQSWNEKGELISKP